MAVSKWLGHESYVTTLTIYGDYIDTEEGGKAVPLPRPGFAKESRAAGLGDPGPNVISLASRRRNTG
jgi:integrase